MAVNELTEYLKTAFEYKRQGEYKKSIDYFYKSLAIDSDSIEIMKELAALYTDLCQYERAVGFYEQILAKDNSDKYAQFKYAKLLQLKKNYNKSKEIFSKLFIDEYEIEKTSISLFELLIYLNEYEDLIKLYNVHANKLKDSKILYYVALAYDKQGNKQFANKYFQKSYEADNKNISSGVEIVRNYIREDNFDEAEKIAIKLLDFGEDDELYYMLGEIAYYKQNIDLAINYYCLATKINPNISEYYFKIALTFSLKGYYTEAEEAYIKAITIEPNNIQYNYAIAYMYYTNKQFDLSEKSLDYILEINPDDVDSLALKTLILLNKGEAISGKNIINKLKALPNKSDFTYYALSVYYNNIEMWDLAIEYIENAISINKNSLEYKYILASLYYVTGNNDKASAICKQIIEINSKYIPAYILLAKLNKSEKDIHSALKNIDIVMELDNNVSEAYNIRADIYKETKKVDKAIENYKIALSLNPKLEENYEKIAECYYKLNKYNEAYYYYKEATNLDISNAKYRYYMAKCSIYINDKDNAISNFSIMKRLMPDNIEYIKDYSNYLYSIGEKRKAKQILSALIKNVDKKDKSELQQLLKTYK